MEPKDRQRIDYLCKHFARDIDIEKLWPKLLEHRIFNRDDVNIPMWMEDLTSQETILDICNTIKSRGPLAFKNLLTSLNESGHSHLSKSLERYTTDKVTDLTSNNNTNLASSLQQLNISNESSNTSNQDESSKDDYHINDLTKNNEPLVIKVKKATIFKDKLEAKNPIVPYPMRSSPRGLVLIITNIEYSVVDNRLSAQHDQDNLKKLFEDMGFKVIPYSNLTGVQVKEKVKEFSEMQELRRVDSAFIIISSHGDGFYGRQKTEIKGVDYQLPSYESVFCTDIIDYFNADQCKYLSGKPKIFIFQTCRGQQRQKVVFRCVTDVVKNENPKSNQPLNYNMQTTRNDADTLIAYATLPGYVSYRDKLNGSWFIQILCEVFMNFACELHVQDLFLMIDGRLKNLRAYETECQTLQVIYQGFDRHCYINPGLFNK